MDFGYTGGNGSSDDEHEETSNSRNPRRSYHRHTSLQIQQLELFFKECPHPDENQRQQLSRDLGLEPKQIKFWFQNKRTQTKAQNERADNTTLREENERILLENLAIGEALKNVICPTCGDPPFGEEERQRTIQQLKMENTLLKQEHERIALIVANLSGKPFSGIQSLSPASIGTSLDIPPGFHSSQGTEQPLFDLKDTWQFKGIQEMEKPLMIEAAANAMTEMIELLRANDALWIKSQFDGTFVLLRESYNKIFPKINRFASSISCMESSKDSCVVAMPAQPLIEMFLDTSKWADLFPTIVIKAKTLAVIDNGNHSGSLVLMYEQIHTLSPLVAPREFFLLRYCQPLDQSRVWMIVDVSYDCYKELQNAPPSSWKLPSGCIIQGLPNGKTKITWVEHVEVCNGSQTHPLYRDLVSCGQAYGAKRWLTALERTCERLVYPMGYARATPNHELEGVINFPEGRMSILNLCQRMTKDFCTMLNMKDKMDFQNLSEYGNGGIRISVRKSNDMSQPHATIVSAATSFWLPVSPDSLFCFFKDEKMRTQWDVVSSGHPVNEIANISWGSHSENSISIIQPYMPMPHEKSMVMLQENSIDPLGALVVFAPIGLQAIIAATNGEDMGTVLLPSGFTISGDGHSQNKLRNTSRASASTSGESSGQCSSLLTIAFQVLVNAQSRQMNMDAVATVNSLISSTIQKIKAAFNCSENLEM